MTATAVLFLVLALSVIWGGLLASIIFLMMRPQVSHYPPGGVGEDEVALPQDG